MTEQVYGNSFGGNPAENYQRFFVPAIGTPVARDLLEVANLQPGDRVLDVACGTGVVTRMAAEHVGAEGSVAGLDVNPGMLAVARSHTPPDIPIEWHEAGAESMPLPDKAFDIVLCQMGLQFMPDKPAALGEIWRVLDEDGRAFITVPGPRPELFATLKDALDRHVGPKSASFVDLVFSMHDGEELRELMGSAGFRDVDAQVSTSSLHLPPPRDFLWEYIYSTPIAEAAVEAGEDVRETLERDVCSQWEAFQEDGGMRMQVGMTTMIGRK